ncbi:hypothetical protein Hdeb2414_s0007g00256401 [Helianthus debilis subsp. tardiflorus]
MVSEPLCSVWRSIVLLLLGFCARKSLVATDLLRSVVGGGASYFVD